MANFIDQNGFLCSGSQDPISFIPRTTFVTRKHASTYEMPKHEIPSLRCSPSDRTTRHSNTSYYEEKCTESDNPSVQAEDLKSNTNKGWVRSILEAEPCIVTRKGLLLALKHRAPSQVIRFMLTINPDIVDIKNTEGPTPLQVAVENDSSLDIIEMLLRASPFALCITNKDYREDPLTCAIRKQRQELIELLSKDLSYWISERKRSRRRKSSLDARKNISSILPRSIDCGSSSALFSALNRARSRESVKKNDTVVEEEKYQSPRISPPPLDSKPRSRKLLDETRNKSPTIPEVKNILKNKNSMLGNTTTTSKMKEECTRPIESNRRNIDREEINNVKRLCAYLVKAHRKMAQEILFTKDEMNSHSRLLETMGTKKEILEELMQQQRSQFFRNLIALDMKERAYEGKLKKMEKRYLVQLEKRLDTLSGDMKLWNESTREGLLELQSIIDAEAEINYRFRSDMTDWIEKYQPQEEQENNPNQDNCPSHVFATNLGEIDERVPLVGSSITRSSNHSCGQEEEVVGDIADPIIGIGNENPIASVKTCMKRRHWKSLFQTNWERVPVPTEGSAVHHDGELYSQQ